MKIKGLIIAGALALVAAFASSKSAMAAQTALTPVLAPVAFSTYSYTLPFVAIDSVNGNSFPSTGKELVIFENTDSDAHSITITSLPDAQGRSGDSVTSVPASGYVVSQVFPASGWRNTGGNINLSGDAGSNLVNVAVIRIQP